MSLSEQLERVDGAQKNTLKTILTKLGVSVGSQKIDQYPNLANGISAKLNPNNLVSASTASSYGLSSTATTDQVLAKARKLITGAQNAADDVRSDAKWAQIGTADLSGMTANTTGSVTLSGNLRSYAEILLVFLNGTSSSGTSTPTIEVTNLVSNLNYTATSNVVAYPSIYFFARLQAGQGFAHLVPAYVGAELTTFYGVSNSVQSLSLYDELMGGILSVPSATTIEFKITGAGRFASGTLTVYGKTI